MIWTVFMVGATLLLAYANGANDNFKGVVTLYGSETTDYKKALYWASLATFLGSLTALFFGRRLIQTFSGKGLVPDVILGEPTFVGAVILGTGLTVIAASRMGIPISTTHSLTGALAGSGFMAVGSSLQFQALGQNFFLPLVLTPFAALVATGFLYLALRWCGQHMKLTKTTCVCLGEKLIPGGRLGVEEGGVLTTSSIKSFDMVIADKAVCESEAAQRYPGRFFRIIDVGAIHESPLLLDRLHFFSAGAVSFARALNDTPKIVALSLVTGVLGLKWNIGFVAMAMALGGFLGARRVAETMSHKITAMNRGQGFVASIVTAALVILASQFGMPVSTTHVSCGSLFGLGLVNGKARWCVISSIVSAWLLTLPAAAVLAAVSYRVLDRVGV